MVKEAPLMSKTNYDFIIWLSHATLFFENDNLLDNLDDLIFVSKLANGIIA